ncbi:MAG: hypothetical protein IKR36_07925 [Clostridia bacterium]|nr:hypothetical protein [Clostridia bacterium]
MRRSVILSKAFATLGAFLLIAPVFLLVGTGMTPERPLPWLLPALAALLFACAVRALPHRLRIPGAIIALVMTIGGTLAIGWGYHNVFGLYFIALLTIPVTLLHLLALTQQSGEEYHQAVWYAGMMAYLLARAVTGSMALRPARPLLMNLCLAYFVYAVFAMNAQSLHDGMGGGRAPSRLMRLRNRLTSLLICAALLVLTHIPQLKQALETAIEAIKRAIIWLLSLFSFARESVRDAGEAGRPDLGLGDPAGEPSAFLVFLEKVLRIIAIILAAAIVSYVLFLLGRAVVRGIRWLIRKLRDYASTVTEAYEDTVESLVDWGDVKAALRERQQKAKIRREERVPWERLTPRQRVRRSYQIFLRRHPDVPDCRTARQTLDRQKEMAAIYEEARYSSAEISETAAESTRALQKQ